MAKKPELPAQPTNWDVYKIAARAVLLGIIKAPDGARAPNTFGW
jgi:hypothetical protein